MGGQILDGKQLAEKIQGQLAEKVRQRLATGLRAPGLAVVLVGDDHASQLYVAKKRAACERIGFISEAYDLPATTSEEQLIDLIDELNAAPHIDGILVQLPLPKSIDENKILDRIHPDKDVDGFHPHNMGLLAQKRPMLRPCTPYGIITLLKHYELPLKGLRATIVGASNIVGRPMALELLLAGCTTTVCHRFTQDLHRHIQEAQLLIVAIGRRDIVQSDWIAPGAIVVDVGVNRLENGKVAGDIEFESAREKAAWITPVPGGVGPMTVTTLLSNTFFAADKLHGQKK